MPGKNLNPWETLRYAVIGLGFWTEKREGGGDAHTRGGSTRSGSEGAAERRLRVAPSCVYEAPERDEMGGRCGSCKSVVSYHV